MSADQTKFFSVDRFPREGGIFLDLGCFDGRISRFVLENTKMLVHSFDLSRHNKIKRLQARFPERISHYSRAVWTHEANMPFTGRREERSICPGRGRVDDGKLVRTIRFAEWMVRNTSTELPIVVKMDIEGAEYEVIPDMVSHGIFDWVDVWFIDWHHNKFDEEHKPTRGLNEFEKLFGLSQAKSYHWMHPYGEIKIEDLHTYTETWKR